MANLDSDSDSFTSMSDIESTSTKSNFHNENSDDDSAESYDSPSCPAFSDITEIEESGSLHASMPKIL